MKTGNTILVYEEKDAITSPQWSPVMKTGNTFWTLHPCILTRCLNGARS